MDTIKLFRISDLSQINFIKAVFFLSNSIFLLFKYLKQKSKYKNVFLTFLTRYLK